MIHVICVASVISISIAVYCALQIDHIQNDTESIKDYVSSIYQNLPSGGWFCETRADIFTKLDAVEDKLTTEIACLATKNNEDIKRMKDGYAVGDVLKFDGIEMYIFCKTKLDDGRTRWSLFGQNGNEYQIYSDDIPEDIEFVGHADVESLFS